MLRTGPWQAIPAPGNDVKSCRVSSKDGHNADIGRARGQAIGALRRQAEIQVEKPSLRTVKHAPDQREVFR